MAADEPTPEQLEQLARSVAMSPHLSRSDQHAIVTSLRMLAALQRAQNRHPAAISEERRRHRSAERLPSSDMPTSRGSDT
jgi:hypothetical protein